MWLAQHTSDDESFETGSDASSTFSESPVFSPIIAESYESCHFLEKNVDELIDDEYIQKKRRQKQLWTLILILLLSIHKTSLDINS